jgi:hypothetical protein
MKALPSQANRPMWLDLSQLVFNAHFVDLFSDNLQLRLGRCEIAVSHKLRDHLSTQVSSMDPFLGKILQSMFLTQPPCKALGIYMPSRSAGGLELVGRVCNGDGIRIGHLLAELERSLFIAIQLWRVRSQAVRQNIAQSLWTSLSTPTQKNWCWVYPGFPKLVITLESTVHTEKTLVQSTYMQTEDFLKMWGEEWYQDLAA